MKFSKRIELGVDVVAAARQRIRNIFENDCEIVFSTSGGKDSICVDHLLYAMASAGEIDKRKLKVIFVDEEAIYPCIERVVMNMRRRWLMLGVPFEWYAMEFKHYNCLSQLSQDESFVCFDRTKQDVWVRQPPPFAKRSHPSLRPGRDTYQEFFKRVNRHALQITGVRAAESIQRAKNMERGDMNATGMAYPVYDWRDSDVWTYIMDNRLEIPDAYLFMYQCGVARNRLRISQFFSVDTVGSLVKMCEYYPHLFDRICAREPNAYMAMLYYDTELYRRAKKRDDADYKARTLDLLAHPERLSYTGASKVVREIKSLYVQFGSYWGKRQWRDAYQIMIAGDPKQRSLRALRTGSVLARAAKNEKERPGNKRDRDARG